MNNPTSFVYDGLHREIERIDPLGNRATFAYDAAGFMVSNERIEAAAKAAKGV